MSDVQRSDRRHLGVDSGDILCCGEQHSHSTSGWGQYTSLTSRVYKTLVFQSYMTYSIPVMMLYSQAELDVVSQLIVFARTRRSTVSHGSPSAFVLFCALAALRLAMIDSRDADFILLGEWLKGREDGMVPGNNSQPKAIRYCITSA